MAGGPKLRGIFAEDPRRIIWIMLCVFEVGTGRFPGVEEILTWRKMLGIDVFVVVGA